MIWLNVILKRWRQKVPNGELLEMIDVLNIKAFEPNPESNRFFT